MFNFVIAVLELLVGYTYFNSLNMIRYIPVEERPEDFAKVRFRLIIRFSLFLWLGCSGIGKFLLSMRGYVINEVANLVLAGVDFILIVLYILTFILDLLDATKGKDNNDE